MSDHTTWYCGPDGGPMIGIVYELIGSYFDSE